VQLALSGKAQRNVLSFLLQITANNINKHFSLIKIIDMTSKPVTIEDRYHLAYPRALVWKKLNDPKTLAVCIRGCVEMERCAPDKFKAVIRAQLGDIKKDFKIELTVQDEDAPAAYCLSSDVSAGILGRVDGQADVMLKVVDEGHTDLHYVATLSGRGLIGKALPLVEGVAARRVREFFDQFVAHL